MRNNDINFVDVYRAQGKEKRESNTPGKIYLAVFLITVLLLGGVWISLLLDQRMLDNQVEKLESYLNDSSRVSRMNEVEKMRTDVASLGAMEAELSSLNEVMDVIPRFDRQVFNVLYLNRPTNVELQSVEYDGSIVMVNVRAKSVADMSNYALILERTNFFETVYYVGYTAGEAGAYEGVMNVALRGNGVDNNE